MAVGEQEMTLQNRWFPLIVVGMVYQGLVFLE